MERNKWLGRIDSLITLLLIGLGASFGIPSVVMLLGWPVEVIWVAWAVVVAWCVMTIVEVVRAGR